MANRHSLSYVFVQVIAYAPLVRVKLVRVTDNPQTETRTRTRTHTRVYVNVALLKAKYCPRVAAVSRTQKNTIKHMWFWPLTHLEIQ